MKRTKNLQQSDETIITRILNLAGHEMRGRDIALASAQKLQMSRIFVTLTKMENDQVLVSRPDPTAFGKLKVRLYRLADNAEVVAKK